jgi:hypothetical protein
MEEQLVDIKMRKESKSMSLLKYATRTKLYRCVITEGLIIDATSNNGNVIKYS